MRISVCWTVASYGKFSIPRTTDESMWNTGHLIPARGTPKLRSRNKNHVQRSVIIRTAVARSRPPSFGLLYVHTGGEGRNFLRNSLASAQTGDWIGVTRPRTLLDGLSYEACLTDHLLRGLFQFDPQEAYTLSSSWNLKEKRGYWNLKEEALDRTRWRTRFGLG
jgi:hypothetical protein